MATPPAAPAVTISFLIMFFPFFKNGDFIFPETVGGPNVLD